APATSILLILAFPSESVPSHGPPRAPVAGLIRLTWYMVVSHNVPAAGTIKLGPRPTRIGGPLTRLARGSMRTTVPGPSVASLTQTRPWATVTAVRSAAGR